MNMEKLYFELVEAYLFGRGNIYLLTQLAERLGRCLMSDIAHYQYMLTY